MMNTRFEHMKRFAGEKYLREAGELLKIAGPLILASLVTMSISITDVLMMGWLGTHAMAAGAAVSDYYSVCFYFTVGIVAALSPLISQARGAKNFGQVRNLLQQGLLLAIILTIPGAMLVWHADVVLAWLGIEQSLIETGRPYAHVMAFSYFGFMAVSVLYYSLAAHGQTKIILWITGSALPINATGNYLLMFGNFGFPEVGLAGAGIASFVSASYMFLILLLYFVRNKNLKRYRIFKLPLKQRRNYVPEIIRVGLPIGLSNLGEMGVFLLSTVIMGVFGAEVLAAHTIALRMCGVVYAIPMGLAQAATVRVAFAVGKENMQALDNTMRAALGLSLSSGLALFALTLSLNVNIVDWFMADNATDMVRNQAVMFLFLLAILQPFDSLGSVGAGILRGLKQTKQPMYCSLMSFWGIGFAGGWSLAFIMNFGGLGIWIGLAGSSITYSLFIAMLLFRQRMTHGDRLPSYAMAT